MKMRVKEICEQGDRLFSARTSLVSLWQELAEQFYPERADFTSQRSLGTEYAAHLMTGMPVMVRRELADQIAAMIRPRGKTWFGLAPQDERLASRQSVKQFSEYLSGIQYRAMYDPAAKLARATKETDNDYVTFGQGVMTVELDLDTNTLLYRNWHIRDVVWQENERGDIDTIHREWMIEARALAHNPRYKGKVHSKVLECAKKEPFKKIKCRHVIVPYGEYDYTPEGNKKASAKFKFMSLLVDRENETILEEKPLLDHPYIIPRWLTVSGSQYAHSAATVVSLPDARVLQRITYTLLEAGEKATNPPMLAVKEAIRGDIGLYAGAVTWLDGDYDEKMGEALRPLNMDKSGLNFGADMAGKHEEMIRQAFYLNKIMLPAFDGAAMTATEIRARTEEYIRAALPLFEPIEGEYSGQLCEKTFNILMTNGSFGNLSQSMPEELRGGELKWTFQSPLADAINRQDAQTFQESAQLLSIAAQIDPSLANDYDARTHFRKAMEGLGAPLIDKEKADDMRAQAQEMQELQQTAGMVGQGAGVAEQVGKAAQALGLSPDEMAA